MGGKSQADMQLSYQDALFIYENAVCRYNNIICPQNAHEAVLCILRNGTMGYMMSFSFLNIDLLNNALT